MCQDGKHKNVIRIENGEQNVSLVGAHSHDLRAKVRRYGIPNPELYLVPGTTYCSKLLPHRGGVVRYYAMHNDGTVSDWEHSKTVRQNSRCVLLVRTR